MSSAQVQFRPCRATEDSMVGASAAIPPAKTPFLGIGRSLTRGHPFTLAIRSFLLHFWAALRANSAVKLYHSIRKRLRGAQAQRHCTMPRRNEGNAFPDKGRHDAHDELSNRVLVKEGPDDSPPPIIQIFLPACLRRSSANPQIGSLTNWTPVGTDAGGGRRGNIMHVICAEARAHLDAQLKVLRPRILASIERANFGRP